MSDNDTIPERVKLATFPTPLEAAPRLAAALGLASDRLYLKRDDLTGLGAGGNKARKLERLVATALRNRADTLVTTGAAQSNHARLTAAAGARLGLRVVLVLAGERPENAGGNLLLDGLFGAELRWAGGSGDLRLAEAAASVARELAASGAKPHVIPYGGSDRNGVLAYRDAARELRAQLPGASTSVVAVGSGGTMAGLVAELGAEHVLGVHTGAVPDPRAAVAGLLAGAGAPVEASDLRLRLDQVGAGYSALAPETAAAIRLAARTEGVVLDPVYTGRALAGLVAALRDGEVATDAPVVFWHTGGLPGLFGHREAAALLD